MENTTNLDNKDNLNEKVDQLKSLFSQSQDFVYKEHKNDGELFELLYIDSLVNLQYLDQYILPKLSECKDVSIKSHLQTLFQIEEVTFKSMEDVASLLFEGNVIFYAGDSLLSLKAGEFPKRQPGESALETSIRGPKDGFVEDIKTNVSLIRRRLNTPTLCMEKFTIGKRSKTKVVLMYLDDVIDKKVLHEIRTRLNGVELDILTSAYELESSVRDRPYSVFPTMDFSGRPDFVVQVLNQGRFALLVDGNPTVSFAPVNLLLQTKSPEDTYIS